MSDQQQATPPLVHAQPCPVSYAIQVHPVPDGTRLVSLRLEHVAGSTIVFLPNEFAKQLGHALIEKTTGLVLAKPGEQP